MDYKKQVTETFLRNLHFTGENTMQRMIEEYYDKYYEKMYTDYTWMIALCEYYECPIRYAKKLVETDYPEWLDRVLASRDPKLRGFFNNPDYMALARNTDCELLLLFFLLYTNPNCKYANYLPEYVVLNKKQDVWPALIELCYWVYEYVWNDIRYTYKICDYLKLGMGGSKAALEYCTKLTDKEIEKIEGISGEYYKFRSYYNTKVPKSGRGWEQNAFDRRRGTLSNFNDKIGLAEKKQEELKKVADMYIENPDHLPIESWYLKHYPNRSWPSDRSTLGVTNALLLKRIQEKSSEVKKELRRNQRNNLIKINKLIEEGISMLEYMEKVPPSFYDLNDVDEFLTESKKTYRKLSVIINKWDTFNRAHPFSLVYEEKVNIAGKDVTTEDRDAVISYMNEKGYPKYYMLYSEILRKYMKGEMTL